MSTCGTNHLGLTVQDLDQTTEFFTSLLDWSLLAKNESCPRPTVSDGTCRLTLWQADKSQTRRTFNRKTNIGLHHVAFEVSRKGCLFEMAEKARNGPGVQIEFEPGLLSNGPRIIGCFMNPAAFGSKLYGLQSDPSAPPGQAI